VALGVLPDSSYEERPIALREGDLLVFYTDGVSEAENEMGEQFGEERLEQVARANADLPAEEILRVIVSSVVSWTGDKGPSDDLTLIVVRKTGPTP
jgi:sigma-B regulation protein RsbU (phosphoserine phosphatase)